MLELKIDYEGQLHCNATHSPSGSQIQTDAPVDNHGKGETFSPTDLLATALATCMATVMGIAADRKGVDLAGMRMTVGKFMSQDNPRRIEKISIEIFMPIPQNHPDRKLLQSTVLGCPVHHSINPEIEVPLTWHWSE